MSTETKKYRLLTRSDFDGLVCAILLKEMGILGSIEFVHPKDVQDGKIEVTEQRHPDEPALRARAAIFVSTIIPAKKSGPRAARERITF